MRKFMNLIALAVLTSCISEYEHPDVKSISGILVVESTITNDTTFVRLSRSVELTENTTSAPMINHATVTIEAENGSVLYPAQEPENGIYTILTGALDPTTRYRLKIELDQNSYVSEFLEPLITPEVESLDLYKRTQGAPVQLRITTQNSEENSRFYQWSFEEIWEYAAPFRATHYQSPYLNLENVGEVDVFEYHPYSPYYYCWSFGKSKSLLLGSSVKLSTNRIENYAIGEFDAASLRFTLVYYVKVKQNSIQQEAYNYFSNRKENAESTGSIFGPVPSEMKGNITCLTDESIPVIGYVEVSTTQWREQFFTSFKEISEYPGSGCRMVENPDEAAAYGLDWGEMTVVSYSYDEDAGFYAYPRCVDCRKSGGGAHDKKPSFWPNDHI